MRRSAMMMLILATGIPGCKKSAQTTAPSAATGQPAAEPTAPAAPAAPAAPNRAAARAANVQGMKSYKIKDYAAATEKFRAALVADPSFPLAHYNLACVAALTNDKATARAQLEWHR